MQRTILPIVYEDNDPVKIRAAFAAGCGGVIVDGRVPDAVATEVRRMNLHLQYQLKHKDFALRVEDVQDGLRQWVHKIPELQETCRWLEEQYAQARAGGLTPLVQPGSRKSVMTAWFGGEMVQPWHIDRKVITADVPDMHIHVIGQGMIVAAPPKPLSVTFDSSSRSISLELYGDGHTEEDDLDYYLKKRGVEFITLQPGQRLYFGEGCLHRSAYSANLKLRAAIF